MANSFTVATFNVENLFVRYSFRGKRVKYTEYGKTKYKYREYTDKELREVVKGGFIIDRRVFRSTFDEHRTITAKAAKALKADVLGLQEVENLDTLKTFNSDYLKGTAKFKYPLLIDGNDPRLIDVAVLSDLPIDFVRTHQYLRKANAYLFSRDCLEVHVCVGKKIIPIFVNHLKSMVGGREETKGRRITQCDGILEILKSRFGTDFGKTDFIVLGDFNDYMEPGKENESGIRALLESSQMENVINRLPQDERWTHYYKKEKDKGYHQLDYILISKSLAQKNPDVLPVIERRGMPRRAQRVKKFFPEVKGEFKASDHCPVAITLNL